VFTYISGPTQQQNKERESAKLLAKAHSFLRKSEFFQESANI
jgi:hypothetical protein